MFRTIKVLTPAKTYDLVDRATVKSEFGLSSSDATEDAWIGQAITQVSALIAMRTGHVFPIEIVQEGVARRYTSDFFDAGNSGAIGMKLNRWPVVRFQSFTANSMAQTEGTDFAVDYDSGLLIRLSSSGAAIPWYGFGYPFALTYASGHAIKTVQASNIPAPPATITIADFELDCGMTFAVDGAALTAVGADPMAGQYTVSSSGAYLFNASDAGKAVNITWAKTAIPGDIVLATLKAMTMRYKGRRRDPLLIQQTQGQMGDQRFWVGSLPNQDGPFPPEIEQMLEPYRQRRFG